MSGRATIPPNTRTYVSDSSLHRAEECPASQALPCVGHVNMPANVGSAIHDHLELRAKHGIEKAFAEIEAICDRWGLVDVTRDVTIARCHKFKWVPPDGATAELPLAWDAEGRAIMVDGGRGTYNLPPGAWGPGTIDILWSEPEPLVWTHDPRFGNCLAVPHCPEGSTLFVADYKTGEDRYVPPVENNPQVASGAAKAANLTGAKNVVAMVIFVTGEQGVWDVSEPWGPGRLAAAKARVRAIHDSAMQAKADVAKGVVRPREGMHCLYCDAFTHCPAKVDMITSVLGSGRPCYEVEDDLPKLVATIAQVETFVRNAKALLRASVEETGKSIDLGGGLYWGEKVGSRLKFVSHKTLPVLKNELGEDAIDAFETTKARIRAVVKAHLEAQGIRRKGAPTARRILEQIEKAGGSYLEPTSTYTWYREDDDNDGEDFEV